MQALYAHEMSQTHAELLMESLITDELVGEPKAYKFAKQLFLRTLEEQEELDEIIQNHAANWDLGRIAMRDRVLLRMATSELLFFEDIPPKVSIDEAIEIAKKFSTEKSASFVNGVLDAVLVDLKEQGRLNKSGRGLIGMKSINERVNSE